MNNIKYIIIQWVSTTDTKEGVTGIRKIKTHDIFQEGMFLENGIKRNNWYEDLQKGMIFEDSFYHRDRGAKIANTIYEEDCFGCMQAYITMEKMSEPMWTKKQTEKLFIGHGWKIDKNSTL